MLVCGAVGNKEYGASRLYFVSDPSQVTVDGGQTGAVQPLETLTDPEAFGDRISNKLTNARANPSTNEPLSSIAEIYAATVAKWKKSNVG